MVFFLEGMVFFFIDAGCCYLFFFYFFIALIKLSGSGSYGRFFGGIFGLGAGYIVCLLTLCEGGCSYLD